MAPEPDPADMLDSGEAGGQFIRGGLSLTAAYIVNLLLSLAAVPLVIRHLGPVDYGRFATVTAIIFIVAGFTEAGLTSLGVREYSNLPRQERARLLRNLIGLRLTTTALGVARDHGNLRSGGIADRRGARAWQSPAPG